MLTSLSGWYLRSTVRSNWESLSTCVPALWSESSCSVEVTIPSSTRLWPIRIKIIGHCKSDKEVSACGYSPRRYKTWLKQHIHEYRAHKLMTGTHHETCSTFHLRPWSKHDSVQNICFIKGFSSFSTTKTIHINNAYYDASSWVNSSN